MTEHTGGSTTPAADFDYLNATFYASDPAAFFRMKLTLLVLVAGKEDEVGDLIDAGVGYHDLVLETHDGGDGHVGRVRLQAYLVTESESVLHHAAETLLRLFMAHAGLPACPWLEVASLMSFREFRERTAEVIAQAESHQLDDAVSAVFLAGDTAAAEYIEPTRKVLLMAATRLRDDANAYNSVKHVPAVQPGEASFSIATSDGSSSPFTASGPSISYLEREKDPDGGATWYTKTRWVDVRSNLFLAQLITSLIDSLWSVARARYVRQPLDGLNVVTSEALEALRASPTRPVLRNARLPVLREPPPPPTPARRARGRGRGPDA